MFGRAMLKIPMMGFMSEMFFVFISIPNVDRTSEKVSRETEMAGTLGALHILLKKKRTCDA